MSCGTASATPGGIVALKPLALLLAFASLAPAVGLRVATFNIGAHFVGSAPDYSLGDPGTIDHESVKAVLDRVDADVVALEEIASADVSGNPDDLDALAASLGYSYIYVAPTSGGSTYTAPLDNTLRVVFLSRFPFITSGVVASPTGAREMTRLMPVVKVDVPGTVNDPVMIAAHLKSGTATDDRFRRAVEMKRLTGFLSSQGITSDDNFIIMGDFNFSSINTTFTTVPSGVPVSYDLGDDITLPITYSTNPLAYFGAPGVTRLDPRQVDGSAVTFPTSSSTIDLFLVSPAIAGRQYAAEVYNSALDSSNGGLPKAGQPLASSTSADASDHLAMFADFQLDADLPNLSITLSAPSVLEASPDGTVTATVTLPALSASSVTVAVTSDDPASALPLSSTVIIPANTLSGSVAIRTPRNFLDDVQHSVSFTATAFGYDPKSVVLNVEDVEGPYIFTAPGQTVTENFDGFAGNHDPAPWTTSGGFSWLGFDSGSSATAGLRSYGSATDGSLGFLPQGSGTTASATFVNQSTVPLTSLQISFDVEQWHAELNGTADTVTASLLVDGQPVSLPGLHFTASQSLPTGAVSGGVTTTLSATATGLSIPAGASFALQITFAPGSGGGALPDDIFLNEFHYDNVGDDTGEFIEIAVGTGYTGFLSDISVVLYNGDNATNGVPYNTLNLSTAFSLSGTYGGYGLFVANLPANGIQNGPRDGFAIVRTSTSEVLQFLSYEGTFTAGSGPAAGMTSTSVGVSQNAETVGIASLGLTGTGDEASDFTWAKSTGAYTKGTPNEGQTFVLPAVPSQGLAIDNLSVTFIGESDFDGDGIADSIDPDDDNDGQSDADELAFGTNPLDSSSVFRTALSALPGQAPQLSFPGASGITYTLQSSPDLTTWSPLSTHVGSGQPITIALPTGETRIFFRVTAGGQ